MKKNLAFALFLVTFCTVNAQLSSFQKPDYEKIKKDIQDSSSLYFYPKLMTRLVALDTTLTNEEYRHLYYGYIYQKEYQPYWKSTDEEKLLKFYRSKDIKPVYYDEIIRLATHSIDEFPFDLRQLNFLGYTYHMKGNEDMAQKISVRFNKTFGAILSSGDGKTCETGFHVISVAHEYVFLNYFQFSMTSQSLTGNCDYLELQKDNRDIKGIYFDIEKMLNLQSLKFKGNE